MLYVCVRGVMDVVFSGSSLSQPAELIQLSSLFLISSHTAYGVLS